MNHSIYRFTLDIHKTKSQVSIPILLGDTNVQFQISINDGGTPYQLTSRCGAKIAGKKSNGDIFYHDCEIDDNRIIYTFKPNTANVKGVTNCEIRMYGPTGVLTTPRFFMVVDEKVVLDGELDDYIESFTDISGLDGIVVNEQKRVAAEEERVIAEEERQKLYRELLEAKENGEFNGTSVTHEWINGTILKITSASGESQSANLRGEDGKTPYINKDGYWYIDEKNTNVRAEGVDGKPGEDGKTPYIKNDYWFIGEDNTGVKAKGEPGQNGVGILKIEKIFSYGLEDTYQITFTNNTTTDFVVTNGTSGDGTGCAHDYVKVQDLIRNTTDCTTWRDLEYCSKCENARAHQLHKEHDIIVDEAVAPTCTKTGLTEGSHCTRCDYKVAQEEVPATGHSYNAVVTAPTCEAEGYTTYTCHCGDEYVADYTDALGHDLSDWVFDETTQMEIKTCSRCDEILDMRDPEFSYLDYDEQDDGTWSVRLNPDETIPEEIKIFPRYKGSNVTTIGDYAFAYCASLKKVEIPDTVTSIGATAFYNCNGLTSISVDENNQHYQSIDGNLYSKDGSSLVQYAIGKEDTSFEIPNSVVCIEAYAFKNGVCLKKVESYGNLSIIRNDAFRNCSNLTEVVLSSPLSTIGDSAFYDCTNLVEIDIPDSVTSIGIFAFYNCSALKEITIHATIKTISEGTFMDCTSLESITICEGVESIGNYAFYKCSELKKITIPDTVTSIGYWVFSLCSSDLEITVDEGNKKYYVNDNGDLIEKTENGADRVLFCKTGVISSDISSIGTGAFYGNMYAAPIKIPLSVTDIQPEAFKDCDGLTVYVEAESEPEGWLDGWHDGSINVIWGYKEDHSCSHEYGSWTTTVVPTCTKFGSMQRTCSICGNVETAPIEPLGHNHVLTSVTEPTCEDEGYTTYTCTRCGDSYKADFVPNNGHDMDGWVVVTQPTCTTEGLKRATCQACGLVEEQTIPPIAGAHNYKLHENVAATCTEQGYVTMKCSICGYEDTEYKAALGHAWSDWEDVHPAECEIDGTQERTCARCGEVETRNIPATGHDWDTEVEVVEPTCGEQGYTVHTCNACGETKRTNYTDATGLHNWGEWNIIIPPDCTVEGEEKCTCTVCGIVNVAKIPMTDHTPSDWIIDKEPTTEEEGLKHKDCTVCGQYLGSNTIPKLEVEDTNTYLVTESGEFLTDEQGNLLIL
jgi:hypothetical protein